MLNEAYIKMASPKYGEDLEDWFYHEYSF
jgi:hypothetical protein